MNRRLRGFHTTSAILSLALLACAPPLEESGETAHYLGQAPPGSTPELFAPGIVNTADQTHSCPTFSVDGREMLWSRFSTIDGVRQERIWIAELRDGAWTQPRLAPFASGSRESGPRFSPDGRRLFYTSLRPLGEDDPTTGANIWVVERSEAGWGVPRPLEAPVNTPYQEWCPTVAKSGNLYFMFRESSDELWDLFVAEYANGAYSPPTRLPAAINGEYVDGFPFVDPDESFLIFYSERPGGTSSGPELYISYRSDDGSWSEATSLGEPVNSLPSRFAGLTPDGRFFLFGNRLDDGEAIHWIDRRAVPAIDIESNPRP